MWIAVVNFNRPFLLRLRIFFTKKQKEKFEYYMIDLMNHYGEDTYIYQWIYKI